MKKPVSKGYILSVSTYITFLKWKNYRNGDQISTCQGIRSGWGGEVDVAVKGQHKGSLWWWQCSVSMPIWVVVLPYSFADVTMEGKWVKCTGHFSLLFIYNCMWIYNDHKTKSLNRYLKLKFKNKNTNWFFKKSKV